MLRTLSRTVVGAYLKLLRSPFDAALRVTRRGEDPNGSAPGIALDRVEAAARSVAGSVLRDETLRDDARKRRAAADKRAHARRLHGAAQERVEVADERLVDREQEAARRRRQVAEQAKARSKQADEQRDVALERAADVEKRRKESTEDMRQRQKEAIASRARRARLDSLSTEAASLEKKDNAVTAADEALRLRKAAQAAKAERKSD